MTAARLVGRLMCCLGHHDWYVHKQEERKTLTEWLPDPSDRDGCFAPLAAAITVVLALANVVTGSFALGDRTQPYICAFATVLCIDAVLCWVISLIIRYEKRYDRQCIRCNRQELDVTGRKNALESTKGLFVRMDEK